ncbi:MAG: hypothetical protein HY958_02255 [Bacteroidia bacterium]|nr:hypothetical protein [Bacteroidia bacterium]
MSHAIEDTSNLSPEEIKFRDFIRRGDDFSKIEIYRLALEWYNKALELNIEKEHVVEKINFCTGKLKFEKKVFVTLAMIAVIIIGIVVKIKW